MVTLQDLKITIFGFWHFFEKWQYFKNYFILIICHFGHFSFSKLFLNVALYTLVALSCSTILTPTWCAFFSSDFNFLITWVFFMVNIAVVSNVPGNGSYFTSSWDPLIWLFWPFPRQKGKFQGPNFLTLTNFLKCRYVPTKVNLFII